ncbi:MAG: aroE [Acidimicrobiaceae bacterium]|nr:aroE [Acidimicrobiaceae bacterium]
MNWRLGVVGSPVAHSLSPQLHQAGLSLAGRSGTSTRVELPLQRAGELDELVRRDFDALSVTSPLKHAAFMLCDELSDVARRTESVNSLRMIDDKVHGVSTDGDGFIHGLEFELGPVVANAHVVVLGAGGAASAIVDALVRYGAASVVVHGRTAAKVDALVQRYSNVHASSLVYRPVELIVNTVPVAGRSVEAAVLQGVRSDTVAIDITYDPRSTEWRERYSDAGCRTANGLAMLAFQAALQMRWWWGVDIEGGDLLEAL